MPSYDAFISYNHAKDKPLAMALQSAVQRLGKPWYRRRALRVFRDDSSLSATPSLWPAIEQALEQSKYLILLASPEAAASPWVSRELLYWLDNKSADTLLIALADGDLRWDHASNDFDWRAHTSLPPVLVGRFTSEPRWVDLRRFRAETNPRDIKFIELAADFAAAIHEIAKEDLLSQEIRQQRRALALAWSAAASLLIFAGVAVWQWNSALREAARAERNFITAKSTIDSVMVDLVIGLRDIEGMRVETARRILGRAEGAIADLAARTDNDPQVRRSQAVLLALFADAYTRLGDRPLAIEYLRKSLELFRALNMQGHHTESEIAAVAASVGGLLRIQGDIAGALVATRESLDIRRSLLSKNPKDSNLRSDLSTSLYQLGDALKANGELGNAFEAYRESVEISRTLVKEHPTRSDLQRLLSVGLERIGTMHFVARNYAEALVLYRETLDIAHSLVNKDRDNLEWAHEFTASLELVGDVLHAQGNLSLATSTYRDALAVRRDIAARDPDNFRRQTNVVLLLVRLAMVGDDPRGRWTEALAILRPLKSKLDPVQQGWIPDIERELAKITPARGR